MKIYFETSEWWYLFIIITAELITSNKNEKSSFITCAIIIIYVFWSFPII